MEYHSALKREEIRAHATAWMGLEGITLNEISQSQRDKHCMMPLTRGTQGLGEGGSGKSVFNRGGISAGETKKFWRWITGDSTVNVPDATELYT